MTQSKDARSAIEDGMQAVEAHLHQVLGYEDSITPPRLQAAMLDAVFPGGARLRPSFCLAVAWANDLDPRTPTLVRCAVAVELMHSASLVHDDLPCFDHASMRRGVPSICAAYGEATALLVGDGLIVQAFRVLADVHYPASIDIIAHLAAMAGAQRGLVAGQAWELEGSSRTNLSAYHRCKTASLFEFAGYAAAACAAAPPQPWAKLGQHIGLAYQMIDDLVDYLGDEAKIGKPTGQDAKLQRPNAVDTYGLIATVDRLESALAHLLDARPSCRHPEAIENWVAHFRQRIAPYLARVRRNPTNDREHSPSPSGLVHDAKATSWRSASTCALSARERTGD